MFAACKCLNLHAMLLADVLRAVQVIPASQLHHLMWLSTSNGSTKLTCLSGESGMGVVALLNRVLWGRGLIGESGAGVVALPANALRGRAEAPSPGAEVVL